MNNVIKLLREQIVLCNRLSSLFDDLTSAFKETRSGTDVTSSVQKIEPLMSELNKNDLSIQELLKAKKIDNLKLFIEKQPESIEREVATKLLEKVGNLQDRMRHQITNVARLMINNKKFIDYNLNVMAQTVADTTYGPSSVVGQHQRRQVFNANA